MTWNYRVCKEKTEEGHINYSIREVYYKKDGTVKNYMKNACSIDGLEGRNEIIIVLEMMLRDAKNKKAPIFNVNKHDWVMRKKKHSSGK